MSKRTIQVDMSPEAIESRFRELAQLYRFGKELKKAKFLGPVNPDAQVDLKGLKRVLPGTANVNDGHPV